MYKIGDFSRLGQVSTRMLRHYDQLGLLRPSQVDRFTSYRYYTIDQLSRLHRIVALKDLGFSLEQVAELLGPEGKTRPLSAERLRGMLALRQAELAQELDAKRLQLAQVEARLAQIEREGQPSPYEVAIKRLEPLPVGPISSGRACGNRSLVSAPSRRSLGPPGVRISAGVRLARGRGRGRSRLAWRRGPRPQ